MRRFTPIPIQYLIPTIPNLRTARGWNKGTAISFATPSERPAFEMVQRKINKQGKRGVCALICHTCMYQLLVGQPVIQPYEVRIKDFESFQLRARVGFHKAHNID